MCNAKVSRALASLVCLAALIALGYLVSLKIMAAGPGDGSGPPANGPGSAGAKAPIWNDFSLAKISPSAAEIKAHKTDKASDNERQVCVDRLRRAVKQEHVPIEARKHVIPLKDWKLAQAVHPGAQPKGNVFMVRKHVAPYVLQVTEGLGYVIVEIRRSDGKRLVEPNTDLAGFALRSASQWLSKGMQPGKDQHRAFPSGRVAIWPVSNTPDSEGFAFSTCQAFTDGTFLRYEVYGFMGHTARAFQPPAPYLFGEEKPEPTVIHLSPQENAEPSEDTSSQEETKEEGDVLHKDLTPEEWANERN